MLGWPTSVEPLPKEPLPVPIESAPLPPPGSITPPIPTPPPPHVVQQDSDSLPRITPDPFHSAMNFMEPQEPLTPPSPAPPVVAEEIAEPLGAPTIPAVTPVLSAHPSEDRPPWPMDEILPEPPSAPAFLPPAPSKYDHFPIPQTVSDPNSIPPTAAPAEANIFLPSEVDVAVKPKNLIQLACLFPEGQDKLGQQFAKQLRAMGASSSPVLAIEPVLVSSWLSNTIDINAWAKSAQLSGADVMFILAPRPEMSLFQTSTVPGFPPTVPTRVVALEHVPLRTLYNDILIEFKRKM